jgi:putative transposase
VVAPGLPHHVTQRGNNRELVFFSDDDRWFYLLMLMRYCRRFGVDVWAYCLMDNHVHIMGVPRRADALARCFAGTNLSYTQHVNRVRRRCGRLWQNRFFSCPVDRDEYLWPVLRYIEANPVRSGLARRAWEYAWSSAQHHVLGRTDPVVSQPQWLTEALDRRRYRTYLQQYADEANSEVRRRTANGRPLGSRAFTARLEAVAGRALMPGKAGRPRLAENMGSVPD